MTDIIERMRTALREARDMIARQRYPEARGAFVDQIDAVLAEAERLEPRFRHQKRGSTYRVVGAGMVQTSTPLVDMEPVVIYQSEHDGSLWARPPSEFHDGRFVPILDQPKPTKHADYISYSDTLAEIQKAITPYQKAIEAAAKALYERNMAKRHHAPWDSLTPEQRTSEICSIEPAFPAFLASARESGGNIPRIEGEP